MSKENVIQFLQEVCNNKTLQEKIKAASEPLPLRVFDIAQEHGYNFTKLEIAEHISFNTFYKKFQEAIAKHQSGQEDLSVWLKKWQAYVNESEIDDIQHKISRLK